MKSNVLWITATIVAILAIGAAIFIVVNSAFANETTSDSLAGSLLSPSHNGNLSSAPVSGQIYNSWDDFPYNNMRFIDEDAFKYLKNALGGIDYYGEFEIGNTNVYDFYKEKYNQLIRNEAAFIDTVTGEEVFLNQFETLAGYMECDEASMHHLKNKVSYLFDVDEDDTPELCISSEYIFKYVPDLGKCILWGGHKGNFYYSIIGSRKITWDHGLASEILHSFYQFDESGKVDCSTFFFIRRNSNSNADQSESSYIIALPSYSHIDEQLTLPKEIERQAYSFYADYYKREEIVYCFCVTEEQYDELTKDYFAARELANEKIKEVTFTYDELFEPLYSA